jgi:hypothetical protein
MPDYARGKIYTIRCRTDQTLIYVGSTTQALSQRISEHRTDSKRKNYMILYDKIEEFGGWSNWYIELYEDFPCNSLEQLLKREGEIIRMISTLNIIKFQGENPK